MIDDAEGSSVSASLFTDSGSEPIEISPIVLRALIERGVLVPAEARRRLDSVAETRSWLGAPIYRRARSLLSPAESE